MKIHIVGEDYSVRSIFVKRGHSVVKDINEADAVVFTGGIDINPELYGQEPVHGGGTYFNRKRDAEEVEAFKKSEGKLRIGICRGAQLLNVLSGGSLFQHADGHHGTHKMVEVKTGREIMTSSIHHQMMRPTKEAEIIAVAEGQSSYRFDDEYDYEGPFPDPEVVYYPKERAFCFQGHPEYGHKPSNDYFFEKLEELGLKQE